MISPTTDEVFALSDCFFQYAKAVEVMIDTQPELDTMERNALFDHQIDLLRIAGEINMFGTALVFDDVKATLQKLDAITAKVNEAIAKAQAVQSAINIATNLILLGNAILAKDPKTIVKQVAATGKVLGIGV